MPLSPERKTEYFEHMKELLGSYSKCFVVSIDNVGSNQLQKTRQGLRGSAEILMGKNTMMRKIIKEYAEENPGTSVEQLVDVVQGNVGFVFTNGDLGSTRKIIEENVRPAPAKVGAIAPCDVVVPKGPTGCDPGQTAFFQTLQIGRRHGCIGRERRSRPLRLGQRPHQLRVLGLAEPRRVGLLSLQ